MEITRRISELHGGRNAATESIAPGAVSRKARVIGLQTLGFRHRCAIQRGYGTIGELVDDGIGVFVNGLLHHPPQLRMHSHDPDAMPSRNPKLVPHGAPPYVAIDVVASSCLGRDHFIPFAESHKVQLVPEVLLSLVEEAEATQALESAL